VCSWGQKKRAPPAGTRGARNTLSPQGRKVSAMLTVHESEIHVMRRSTSPDAPFVAPQTIPVVIGDPLRSGTPLAGGFIPAGALIPDRYEIPYFDPRTKKGYQRQPQAARINQLANDLKRERVDLPTAILLNLRNRDARHALVNGHLDLEALLKGTALATKFYVVDGQHRVLALEKLIQEEGEHWLKFRFPFVCMIGASEEQEMEQFYIVNSTAKSVRTDLALALLRRRADEDEDVLISLQERGREWQVKGQTVVETLAVESPIWKYRIRLPAMEKGDTTISSASMVASLKPLFSTPYFSALKPESQIKILDAYWAGIREALRPAFDDPTKFTVQKGVGVMVLHNVLPYVLEIVRNGGHSVVEAESYSQVLQSPLMKLEGDDALGQPVTGVDFWAVAPVGAAGAYSGSSGRRVLTAKIKQLLPEVDVA
jgi:DGQHR domain-containing protein